MESFWQAYVDKKLIGSGHIDAACIWNNWNISENSVLAASPNFKPSLEQVRTLLVAFSDPTLIYANGFYIGSENYICIESSEDLIRGRKENRGEGVVVAKTKQTIIIGHHPDTVYLGQAKDTVCQLAEYLIGVGY